MKITSSQFIYPEKKTLRRLLRDWRPRVNGADSSIQELKVCRLGTKDFQIHLPKGDEQRFWYGIHFVSQPAGYSPEPDTVKLFPFIALLNSDFEFVTRQKNNGDEGFLLLLNHSFLPKKINQKLRSVHFFIDHAGKSFALSAEQVVRLNDLFQKIIDELSSTYIYKPELLAILLMQLAHFLIRNFTPSKSLRVVT